MKWDPYDELANPHLVYRWLRDEAPVYKTPKQGFYALSRHADIVAALLDHGTFSSRLSAFPKPEHLPIVQMDPPKHDELRAVVSRPFLPREVEKLEASIRALVTRRLDEMAEGTCDFVTAFAERVPSDVVGGLLGVPEEDRPGLRSWAGEFMARDPGSAIPPARSIAAIQSLKDYFIALRPERDRSPRQDLITAISQARVRQARLSDADYAALCAMVAIAGYETTTNLICHALVELFKHPEQRMWLARHLEACPNAIKETLRYCTPTQLVHRTATRDVQLHDVNIPRGSPVVLLLVSAGRDERRYQDAERYDIHRVDVDSLAFGQGRHTCFGAPLAKLETRIVLEEVLRRFPKYQLDLSGTLRSGPSSSFGYQRIPGELAPSV